MNTKNRDHLPLQHLSIVYMQYILLEISYN